MEIGYSRHWMKKQARKKRNTINDAIEYVIRNSDILNDKYWEDTWNAVSKIPPSGRTLKVIYKRAKQKIFIITAKLKKLGMTKKQMF